MNGNKLLLRASAVYGAGFVVHNLDHMRRGVDATPEPVVWAGTGVAMLSAVIITLIVTGHRNAPRIAALGGAMVAVGVAAVHLIPEATSLTDPLTVTGISPLSWIAVLSEIVGAMVLALAGWYELQGGKGAPQMPRP